MALHTLFVAVTLCPEPNEWPHWWRRVLLCGVTRAKMATATLSEHMSRLATSLCLLRESIVKIIERLLLFLPVALSPCVVSLKKLNTAHLYTLQKTAKLNCMRIYLYL